MKPDNLVKDLESFLQSNNIKLRVKIKTGYDEGEIFEATPRSQFIDYEGVAYIDLKLETVGGW